MTPRNRCSPGAWSSRAESATGKGEADSLFAEGEIANSEGRGHDARALAKPWRAATQAWLADAADAIALAINSAVCLLDLDAVIVDGSFGRELLAALLQVVAKALDFYSWEGVSRPQVLAGTVGSDARAIGGAMLPLHAAFAPDRELFLKDAKAR